MTPLQYLLQQAINAVSIGSLYALMAIGLAMVFGILRLINFAHGDLIMVGSYVALLTLLAGAAVLGRGAGRHRRQHARRADHGTRGVSPDPWRPRGGHAADFVRGDHLPGELRRS